MSPACVKGSISTKTKSIFALIKVRGTTGQTLAGSIKLYPLQLLIKNLYNTVEALFLPLS